MRKRYLLCIYIVVFSGVNFFHNNNNFYVTILSGDKLLFGYILNNNYCVLIIINYFLHQKGNNIGKSVRPIVDIKKQLILLSKCG